jgi:hypothetical protein
LQLAQRRVRRRNRAQLAKTRRCSVSSAIRIGMVIVRRRDGAQPLIGKKRQCWGVLSGALCCLLW